MDNKVVFRIFKTLLIILSCLTIFSILIIMVFNKPEDPLASFETMYCINKYMWVSWLLLPITLACLIFGIVMTKRKMKAITNIVIGSLFSIYLLLAGSATFINTYITDSSFWKEISDTLSLNLPNDMSIITISFTNGTQKTTDSFLIRLESVARFSNKENCQSFKASLSDKWTTDYTNDSIPYSFSFEIMTGFDYFLIYCLDNNEFNPSSFVSENRYVCISFSESKGGLLLCEYKSK